MEHGSSIPRFEGSDPDGARSCPEWVARLRRLDDRDERAWRMCLDYARRYVDGLLRRRRRGAAISRDQIVADGVEEFWRWLPAVRDDRGVLPGLRTILRREASRSFDQRDDPAPADERLLASKYSFVDEAVADDTLQAILRALPRSEAELVKLLIDFGGSVEPVRRVLDAEPRAFRSRLLRSRKRVRAFIDRWNGCESGARSIEPQRRDTETPRHRDTETPRHRDTETPRHRDTETPRHRDTA